MEFKKILVLLLAVLTIHVFGQNTARIDSLSKLLLSSKDTNRANILDTLSKEHFRIDPEITGKYAAQALGLLKSICFKKGICEGYSNMGLYHLVTGDYPRSLSIGKHSGKLHVRLEHEEMDGMIGKSEVIALYRVVQECLNNIIKYADAKNAVITIARTSNKLSLLIEDDGVGMDVSSIGKGYGTGWKNIHSRVSMLNGKVDHLSSSHCEACRAIDRLAEAISILFVPCNFEIASLALLRSQ